MQPSPLNHPNKGQDIMSPTVDSNLLIPNNTQDDDDLCASISVIMERQNSKRQSKKKRRGSSFKRRLTRSSTHTDSSIEWVTFHKICLCIFTVGKGWVENSQNKCFAL